MMVRVVLSLLALILLLQGPGPALADPAAAPPVWKIDKSSAQLSFEGTQMGAPFQGLFKGFDGRIVFDPDNLKASKADISIMMDSVDAGSSDRTKNLLMPDWFNTAKFPDARFVTTSIEKGLDKNRYVAKGNLTIRDVTLPIMLPFSLDITKNNAGENVAKMNAETLINRLDFGVGQGEWKDTQSVGNQVKIKISLTATEQKN